MADYFEAPDGYGEPCIWDGDTPVIGRYAINSNYWPDVVARMTGTTQTQLETAKVQLKTLSGVVDRLRADMRTWQRAAAERTRERDEATDQLEAMTRACDAYRADRDELSELLAKANDATTITTDDATVNKIMAVWTGDDWLPLSVRYRYALDILAALTGVPHEV